MIAPEISVEHPPQHHKVAAEQAHAPDFSDARARDMVVDLFTPNASTYWRDLLISSGIGWGSFIACTQISASSLTYVLICAVGILALFRSVCFTHELVHLRKGAIPGFRTAWRITCGIPLLIPHFLYRGVHISHHAKRDYGTAKDGEYFPFASRPVAAIALHIAWNLVIPLTAIFRFTVLAWVNLLSKNLREIIMRKASSMTLRVTFSRELPSRKEDLREWRMEEALCSLFATSAIIAVALGALSITVLFQWYVVLASIALLNAIRAIGATHRYHSEEQETDFRGQVTDSVNVESRSLLTLAMCPVGLRFHALHHLFPTLPYHHLEEAHRRLRQQLPKDSRYHQCSISGVYQGLVALWRQAKAN